MGGLEGALAILNTIRRHPRETILQCSHGGSRIEATIAKLQGLDAQETKLRFKTGDIALLTFEDCVLVTTEYPIL